MHRTTFITCALSAALALSTGAAHAAAVGSAFTYPGLIDRGATPMTDTYSMIFRLYDAASGGTQVGTDQILTGVVANNGLFSVTLDFGGAAMNGQARWLDIQVKGAADANYTALSRQPMTATPYALYALNGGTGGSQWISDGHGNITYTGGAAGVTGQSTHFDEGASMSVWVRPGYWVDFAAIGPELGTFGYPYHSIANAVSHTPDNGGIVCKSGTSGERPTITKSLLIRSWGGATTVGP